MAVVVRVSLFVVFIAVPGGLLRVRARRPVNRFAVLFKFLRLEIDSTVGERHSVLSPLSFVHSLDKIVRCLCGTHIHPHHAQQHPATLPAAIPHRMRNLCDRANDCRIFVRSPAISGICTT